MADVSVELLHDGGQPIDEAHPVAVRLPYTDADPLPVDVGGSINIGNLTVQYQSMESTGNSTATPLAAGATFTGAWEDVRDYAAISVAILTDAASATNGAVIQFSDDGLTAIRSVATTIPANVGTHFSLAPQARYVRIVYTNGPTAQTALRSQVLYKFNPPAQVQQPLGAQTTDLNLATVTRAHLASRVMSGPSAGAYLPVGNDGTGRALVSDQHAQPLTDTQLRASRVPVDVEHDQPLTDAQLRAAAVPVAGPLTDAQLRAGAVPVSGPLTDAQLRAGAVPVALDAPSLAALEQVTAVGPLTNTELRAARVQVDTQHAQGLTDTQLRASAVPVSGPLTDAQLRAVALPVSGPLTAAQAVVTPARIRNALEFYASADGGRVAFNASTNILTFSGTTEQALAAFRNPTGSGMDVVLWFGEFSSSANTNFRRYRGATITPTGTKQSAANMGGGTAVPVAEMYVGGTTGATFTGTGGTVSKTAQIGAFNQYIAPINGAVRLRPGQGIRWTITGPGGVGTSLTAAVYLEWFEVPAT